MSASEHKSLPSIGFLTVVDLKDVGLLGGFLAVNPLGRPLEFHCTSPVKATRAQQILYGKSLKPFLCGEMIGQALLEKSSSQPAFVVTDHPDVLNAREFARMPIVCLRQPEEEPVYRVDAAHQSIAPKHKAFEWGRYQATLLSSFESDCETVQSFWKDVGDLDMVEPFQRIREAIQETQA